MPISTRNRDRAESLIINQLSDSPSWLAVMQWLGESFDTIDDMLDYIAAINVYTAQGAWLDLIGSIVGQSREVPNAITFEYFGYAGQPSSFGYGQARYYREGDPVTASSQLPDAEYRQVILARVARNYGDISKVGIVEAMQIIVNTSEIFLQNSTQGGSFSIYIGIALDSNAAAIFQELDIIPRGAGIGLRNVSFGAPAATFGYSDQNMGFAGYGVGSYARRII